MQYRRLLLTAGSTAHKLILDGVDRQQALQAVCSQIESSGLEGPFAALAPSIALAWAECGFPIIEPSHRLTASLMATAMPNEYVEEIVRMPWRCFAILCPAGIIHSEQALIVAVHSRDNAKIKILSFFDSLIHYGEETALSDWNLKFPSTTYLDNDLQEGAVDGSALRKTELLGRLFISICAELGDRSSSSGGSNRSGAGRKSLEPTVVTYKLTRNVSLDVRETIRAYAEGKIGKSPTTQLMVRGHWKLQPHGTQRAQRKLIHVEPYWRGPDDAPIAIRSHTADLDK